MKTMLACLFSSTVLCGMAMPSIAQPAPYDARQDGDIVRLEDRQRGIVVSVLTSVGNMAYSMTVKGHDILRFPFASVDDFRKNPAGLHGIPLLAPWANRLDETAFYANGKRYAFDMDLGNVRGPIPSHGFVARTDQWIVVEVKHDTSAAWLTSRLDVFRQPAWMKQWPFAHAIEVTYRLSNGELEVKTTITNMSADAMPVSIGFHPYLQLTDAPREAWTITVPARTRWLLSPQKIPTGATESTDAFFASGSGTLSDYNLDDVFSDLVRDPQGRATATVKGKTQRIDVSVGLNYRALVIYSPNPANTGRGSQIPPGASPPAAPTGPPPNPLATPNFICFEPMAGISNAINLAHKGIYKELQTIAPGGTWQERFWIKPSGF